MSTAAVGRASDQVYVGRQPILDRAGLLIGFEMLFRAGVVNRADVVDDVTATATVISNLIGSLGLDNVVGSHHVCFLNLDGRMLHEDAIELLPTSRVVIELLETIDFDEDIIERCRALKGVGFVLALDDVIRFEKAYVPLMDLVEVVKVDLLSVPREELPALVERVRGWPGVKLLAERVESRELYDLCHELGFDFFQGYYFAKPLIVVGSHLSPSGAGLLHLLGLLLRDADIAEVEEALKAQPELVMRVLRLVNSVGSGLRRTITSVRDAVVVVGRNQLTRWLKLLLYTHGSTADASSSPLLWVVSQRARHMELMAASVEPRLADPAFLVGILSLLDTLFNAPMDEVLATLELDESIELALMTRQGPLGALLDITEACELDDLERFDEIAATVPGLTLAAALDAQNAAILWATENVTHLAG